MSKLIVSLSPHAHGTDTVEKNMYGVIIALMPALLVSFYFFGLGSAIVCATSVAACVFFEWAINKFMLKSERNTVCDGSAILTGLLLGFNLPSNLPIWIIIIGALFAIGVAKMTFGGLGNNLFNPALVGRAALLVAFPAQMTTWPKVGQLTSYLDAETGATPLAIMKEAIKTGNASVLDQLPSSLDLFLGNHPDGAGAMGEICALALLLGHLAHPRLYHRYCVRVQRPLPSGQPCLCRPLQRHLLRWSDAGCHLHGYRLCDEPDDRQGTAHLWCCHWRADRRHPQLGRLS